MHSFTSNLFRLAQRSAAPRVTLRSPLPSGATGVGQLRLWNSGSHPPPAALPTSDREAFPPQRISGTRRNRQRLKELGLQRLATVQLKSWIKHALEECCADVLKSAAQLDLHTSNVVRLPMRVNRWTLNRSPFVNKSAMDKFERRERNRLIVLYGASSLGRDATKVVSFLRYLEHTLIPAHAACRAKITLFSRERLEPTPHAATAAAWPAAPPVDPARAVDALDRAIAELEAGPDLAALRAAMVGDGGAEEAAVEETVRPMYRRPSEEEMEAPAPPR